MCFTPTMYSVSTVLSARHLTIALVRKANLHLGPLLRLLLQPRWISLCVCLNATQTRHGRTNTGSPRTSTSGCWSQGARASG
jgi:hypothetical protein